MIDPHTLAESILTTQADPTPPSSFESQVLAMLGSLKGDMQSMGTRVANLESGCAQSASTPRIQSVYAVITPTAPLHEVQNTRSEQNQSSPTTQPGWGERPAVEAPDFSLAFNPTWDDEDEDENDGASNGSGGVKLFKVSEKTDTFLKSAFTTAVPNATRRQWREKFGAPNTVVTACPSMDIVVKGRLSAATKSRDKQLARQQTLMLDAVGPVAYSQLTQKAAIEAAQSALKLLGNTSMQANRERRKNAIQCMNPRLWDMAEDDAIFRPAAPALFGESFCKKSQGERRGAEVPQPGDQVQPLPVPDMATASFFEGAALTTPTFVGMARTISGEQEEGDTTPTGTATGPGNPSRSQERTRTSTN